MMIWLAWIGFLLVGMQITLEGSPFILIAIIVLARAFLHTGLFIIAHDAMHDSLAPRNPYLNRLIGQISLFFYAGLSFKQCRYNHRLHHQSPETSEDPDFKSYSQQNIIGWYLKFMSNYLGSQQLIRLALIWIATYCIIHINSQNALYIVTMFYALPLVISSLQLFIVGTWLPHAMDMNPRPPNLIKALLYQPLYHSRLVTTLAIIKNITNLHLLPGFDFPRCTTTASVIEIYIP